MSIYDAIAPDDRFERVMGWIIAIVLVFLALWLAAGAALLSS